MKKISAIIMAIVVMLVISTSAFAADAAPANGSNVVLTKTISTMNEKVDKNGNPYIAIGFKESNEMSGIAFTTTANIMCFSDKVAEVKASGLKVGSTITAVCSQQEYKGRTSYVLLGLGKAAAPAPAPVAAAPAPAAVNATR